MLPDKPTVATGNDTQDSKLRKVLHYGALICISLAEDYNYPGYIFGDGFITKTITYKKDKAFETRDSAATIFKVMPPMSYTAQKRVEEALLHGRASISRNNLFIIDLDGGISSFDYQVLMDAAEREMKENMELANQMKKKPITLGSPIQLLHVKSNKFLSFQLDDKHTESMSDHLK